MAIDFSKSYPIVEWDLNRKALFFRYFGKKTDSARGLRIRIMQHGDIIVPSTETLRLYCEKPDGKRVYIDAIKDEMYFNIRLTNQIYAVAGVVKAELQLGSNGEYMSSETFIIDVDENLVDSSIVSTDDFLALQNALNKVDNFETEYAPRLTDLENNKIDKSSITNNLVTTADGLVLDARQGMVLDDKITQLNNNLAGINGFLILPQNTILDDIDKNAIIIGTSTDTATLARGYPIENRDFCVVETFAERKASGVFGVQKAYYRNSGVYYRYCYRTWGAWVKII